LGFIELFDPTLSRLKRFEVAGLRKPQDWERGAFLMSFSNNLKEASCPISPDVRI
jgi:hypothetical protein